MKPRLIRLTFLVGCLALATPAAAQSPEKELRFKPLVAEKAQGFVEILKVVQELAGAVKQVSHGAAKGIDGGPAAFVEAGALVVEGILNAVSRGVRDPHVRQLLAALGGRVSDAARAIGEQGFSASALVGHLVAIAEPLMQFAVERLPFEDASLRRLVAGGISGVVGVLRDPAAFKAEYLDKPWEMVKAALSMIREFARSKLGSLVSGAHLGPERDLLVGTVDAVFDLLVDDARRESFFGGKGKPASARPLLELLSGVAKPYLTARLRGLTAGTGLEDAIDLAVGALLGPDGPVLKGASFLSSLQKNLAANGAAILGTILGALSSFLEMQIQRAGAGPAVMGLLRGVLAVVRKTLTTPNALASLTRGGASAVIARVGDVISPLIEAMAPNGQKHPAFDFVRTVVDGLLEVLGKLQSLRTQPERTLAVLAAAVAKAAKAAIAPLVRALPIDKALQPLFSRAVAALFSFLGSPAKAAASAGTRVLGALRAGADLLIPYVRAQLEKSLPKGLRDLTAALFAELRKLVMTPQRLRALQSGKLSDVLARAFEVLGKPLARLVESALPAGVVPALRPLLAEIVMTLGNPARVKRLFARTAAEWLPTLRSAGLGLLRKLLALVPDAPKQAIASAIAKVSAALQNPASLTSAAAAAARQALDQTLSGVCARLPDGIARETGLALASLLRELAGTGAASAALRSKPSLIFGRLLAAGTRALARAITDKVPEGAVRTLLVSAAQGLGAWASRARSLGEAAARSAADALGAVTSTFAGAVRAGLRAVMPDPALATLVDSLFEAGLSVLVQPKAFAELQKKGMDALLGRLVPLFNDYLLAAVSRSGPGGAVRGVVESVLRAVAEIFASPRAGGAGARTPATAPVAARSPVARLVGLGIATVKNIVGGLIDGAGVSAEVSSAVRGLFAWVGDLISRPALLASALRQKASELLATAITKGQALLAGLAAGAIQDAPLRELVRGVLTKVGAGVTAAMRSGGGLATHVQGILIGALEPLAAFFRVKLLALVGGPKGGVAAAFVGDAYDALVAFAIDMFKNPNAWQTRIGAGGKKLLGQLAQWAFASLQRAAGASIRVPALRGLVERLLTTTGALLGDIGALVSAVRTPGGAARLFVPKLIAVVKPLIDEELVARLPAGVLRDVVGAAAAEGLRLLADIDALAKLPRMRWEDVKPKLGAFLKTSVVPPIVAALKLGGVMQGVINAGLDRLLAAAK
jgi:hypothetical protein